MTFRKPKIGISRLWLAAVLVVSAMVVLFVSEKKQRTSFYKEQVHAAKMMTVCIEGLRQAPFDSGALAFDPNRTNLIGREYSPITTTLGDLPAKRTATNPDFAALLVRWFHELEIPPGSPIAVGSSGSFPSLVLATLCAAKAMNLQPILIVSLGASTFGANRPDFTFLDMENFLHNQSLIFQKSAAVSLGGSDDLGGGLSQQGIRLLMKAVRRNHAHLLSEKNLAQNVRQRGKIYFSHGEPSVFINIGGARINIGDYETAVRLRPGINKIHWKISPPESMTEYFASQEIPIVHLLNIKKIALKYNLPVDPTPLPEAGKSEIYFQRKSAFWALAIAIFLILSGWILAAGKMNLKSESHFDARNFLP